MVCVFFFQAEDGIRDLVRSRGLGDVYKRQHAGYVRLINASANDDMPADEPLPEPPTSLQPVGSVSYTHLTLPTSDLV